MHLANVSLALKKVPSDVADHVKLVFVTTDPSRDSPVQLRRWLDQFDKRFVGLTGTDAALAAVQKAAGVPVAFRPALADTNSSLAHANFVIAYTRDNRARVVYPGGINAADWIHDLPLLMHEGS
jgi:protein SCO1/2